MICEIHTKGIGSVSVLVRYYFLERKNRCDRIRERFLLEVSGMGLFRCSKPNRKQVIELDKISFPNKKYCVIYADPPWEYKESGGGHRGTAGLPYKTMSPKEIADLPIKEICTDSTILYLWATDPKLPIALNVMKDWGFDYKGVAYVWVKRNRKSDTPFWGMGRYTRKNAEFVLLGVKKNTIKAIRPLVHDSHQIIFEPVREHSRKPDKIREEIVRVCGDIPRIELFARGKYEGWDSWGDEVNKEEG